MGFKLLIKQAFKNLTSKFRLYASLILFLVVGFSIINGLTTFVSSFKDDFKTTLNNSKIANFKVEKFKYASYDSEVDDETVLFKFTKSGQTEFAKFLSDEINRVEDNKSYIDYSVKIDNKNFINLTGQKRGYINQLDVSQNTIDTELIKKLKDVSKYYSKNIMDLFLMEDIFKKQNILTQYNDVISGSDKDTSTDFRIKVRPDKYDSIYSNPFRKSELNKIYYPEQKEVTRKDGIGIYVSDNYLRNNKKKIGDNFTMYVNNVPFDFYAKGIAYDVDGLINSPQEARAYVDLDVMDTITVGSYLNSSSIEGRVNIPNSNSPFDNSKEYELAANKVNDILLKNNENKYDNDIKKTIFDKTAKNTDNSKISETIDYLTTGIGWRYHQPLAIYGGAAIMISIALSILIIVVSVFIIDESIRSEKKTLWFLKSMGESNWKLSLVNSFSVFVPLITALGISVPGSMLMMQFLISAILTNYSFSIHFYQLTWLSIGIFAAFLFGTMIMFMVINLFLIRGKALNISTTEGMSRFQMVLAKITTPMLKNSNPKFRIGFAFVRQNLIKNIVSFFLFTILFTVTLFGIQFNKSIDNQESSYQDWYGDYNGISLLKPRDLFTEQNQVAYQTMSKEEFQKLRNEDKLKSKTSDDLETKYNYDLVALLNGEILKGKDYAKDTEIGKDDLVINSENKTFVATPFEGVGTAASNLINSSETLDQNNVDKSDIELIQKNHPNGSLDEASQIQWTLRKIRNIGLWTVESTYISSFEEVFDKSNWTAEQIKGVQEKINIIMDTIPDSLKQLVTMLGQLIKAQGSMFDIDSPSFNISLGHIIIPNEKDYITGLGVKTKIRQSDAIAYGIDVNNQPFSTNITGLSDKLGTGRKSGVEYKTIDLKLSILSRDRWMVKEGEIIPFDLEDMIPNIKGNYAFKVSGFIKEDAVLLEGVYNKNAIYDLLRETGSDNKNILNGQLDNVVYSKSDMPFFLNNLYVPHKLGDGSYIDDYRFDINGLENNQLTTAEVTKIFVNTVKEYTKLMTKIIILLIVLCIALSLIMITIILFENKKTILLFKAMGYRKRDIIWYLVSGYLIAVLVAFGVAIGLSFMFVFVLKPTMASTIFLQLEFTPYWLFFLIGIFETLGFMALVVASVATYARVLKPRDAFATL